MKVHKGVIICGIVLGLGAWKAHEFSQFQEISYQNACLKLNTLQKDLNAQEVDLAFLKAHQHLSLKNFYSPANRLIAGQCIESVGKTLHSLHYTFEPERSIDLVGYTYNVTKIVIDIAALLDTEVYDFIEKLNHDFPGVLHLSEVNLALNTENPPPYIKGMLSFEWYSLTEKR